MKIEITFFIEKEFPPLRLKQRMRCGYLKKSRKSVSNIVFDEVQNIFLHVLLGLFPFEKMLISKPSRFPCDLVFFFCKNVFALAVRFEMRERKKKRIKKQWRSSLCNRASTFTISLPLCTLEFILYNALSIINRCSRTADIYVPQIEQCTGSLDIDAPFKSSRDRFFKGTLKTLHFEKKLLNFYEEDFLFIYLKIGKAVIRDNDDNRCNPNDFSIVNKKRWIYLKCLFIIVGVAWIPMRRWTPYGFYHTVMTIIKRIFRWRFKKKFAIFYRVGGSNLFIS